ncbi:exonuclease domain-containing protein [Bacillus piscicola]|uniref:exonuclease domain-containing protein n=1 Tax=Bacillus piscicola TaxID=1632684 RepID=UPI001F095AD0|nr:exonuclease domain-containing protein [Bacillus piscicola]
MDSIIERFHLLNSEIDIYKRLQDIDKVVELCEKGMKELPAVISRFQDDVPRFIPCRDVLIQSFAMLDQFKKARDVVLRAYQAGAYTAAQNQAVLTRIDEMERAHNCLMACVADNPGISKDLVQQRLRCEPKALTWYIHNSQTIRRETDFTGVERLWLAHEQDANLYQGKKVAIVDVETTGLSKTRDEIVEIGALLVRVHEKSGAVMEVMEEANELNEPTFSIPERVSRIHGIRDHDVRGKSLDRPRFERIFSESDLITAHNAGFDSSFIQRYFPRTKQIPWHCSVRGIDWKQYGFQTRKLLDLCRWHRISDEQNHRALDDVKLTLALLQKKNPKGDYYLKELLRHPFYVPDKTHKEHVISET